MFDVQYIYCSGRVKFHTRVPDSGFKGSGFKEGLQSFNPERGTVNL
jgi:hypothetical protein